MRYAARLSFLWIPFALTTAGCGTGATGETTGEISSDIKTVNAATAEAIEKPISRFVAVTGTLTAEEQADVSAEIAGRVVSTPVERGTHISKGGELVRIADTEVRAQAQEAEANAGQIEARLGLGENANFQIDRVPEVANARAANELAQADFERARMLSDKQLLSQADFDQGNRPGGRCDHAFARGDLRARRIHGRHGGPLHEELRPHDGVRDHGVAGCQLHADADDVVALAEVEAPGKNRGSPRPQIEAVEDFRAHRPRVCADAGVVDGTPRGRRRAHGSRAALERPALSLRQRELLQPGRSVGVRC